MLEFARQFSFLLISFVILNVSFAFAAGSSAGSSAPPMASISNDIMSQAEFDEWCATVPGCGPSQFHHSKHECGGATASAKHCDGKYHINIFHLYEPCTQIETVEHRIPFFEDGGIPCCLFIYWRNISYC